MKKLIFIITILFLFPIISLAIPVNEKYSYKGFPYHDLSFKDVDVKEFNNTIIIGSSFYQEWTEGDNEVLKDIFPDGMTGVVFRRSNLDNIYIPPGNIVEESSNRRIRVQNDWDDWILESDNKPKEPIDKEQREMIGVSTDPKDIPDKKFTKEERKQFKDQLEGRSPVEPIVQERGTQAGFSSLSTIIIALLVLTGTGVGIVIYKKNA